MTSSDEATTPAFRDFGLPPALLQATDELGFEFSTEIQALTLPVIAAGRDVAAQAQTGTGKTAAFLLGSFSRLLTTEPGERSADQPRMLVIAPTRELAIQIGKDAESLGKYTELKTAVVYGGIDYEKQRAQVAGGIDVLIGTPGRLIDYFKQKVFNLKALEIVVLDEADRMFDLGFIADIRFLLRRMPPPGERTSMLFSATLSHRVMELAYEHMDKPEELKTETTQVTADGVRQSLYHPASDEKIPLLLGLIRDLQPPRSMIFVNTKRAAERIEGYLVGNGITCGLLSGDVRQNKRQRILSDFTGGNIPVLIATDVAARGLHIDDVSHVFNYDLPQNAEDYVHRIGRTAAGRGSGPGGSTPGGRGGKRPSRNGRSQSGSRSGSRSGSAGESGSGSPAPKDGAAKVASPGSPVSSSTEGNTASADAPKKRRRRRRRGGKSAGASSSASSSDTSSQETGSGGNSDG